MKKDHIRDYATAAFVYWAKHGCPTYEEAVARIRDRALRRAQGVDPAKALIYADAEVDKAAAGLCDILACAEVFKAFEDSGKGLVCEAVRAVYMAEPWKPANKHDISSRVLKFAMKVPLSERQVWYYLDDARTAFAIARGMRVEENEID